MWRSRYVLQSLKLWSAISNDMFRLWTLAEEDLLDPATPYVLNDTGQGVNRVQECPRISRAMRELLHDQQLQSGGWVVSPTVMTEVHARHGASDSQRF
eukprot:COSAG01_NODE_7517_length_3170_cov_1.655161_1_plen_98_part_00